VEDAADAALRTVIEEVGELSSVRLIRFVLFSEEDLEVYERVLASILEEDGPS
jgi:O-acetyl-ADP-ribose deacetylase (regulator of RNase III)